MDLNSLLVKYIINEDMNATFNVILKKKLLHHLLDKGIRHSEVHNYNMCTYIHTQQNLHAADFGGQRTSTTVCNVLKLMHLD